MKKVTKSYVEKIYRGLLFSEPSITEVEERDPMKVENDGKIKVGVAKIFPAKINFSSFSGYKFLIKIYSSQLLYYIYIHKSRLI